VYGVAVIIVEDEHLCIPGARWDDESAGLACEDFSHGCVFGACCKALVGAVILWVGCRPVVVVGGAWYCFLVRITCVLCVIIFEGYCWFGGPLVFSTLVKVAFDGGDGLWWVIA